MTGYIDLELENLTKRDMAQLDYEACVMCGVDVRIINGDVLLPEEHSFDYIRGYCPLCRDGYGV